MTSKLISRAAGALLLTLGLAGCIDMTAEIDVLSETTGKATTITTMGAEFYPMIKSMAEAGAKAAGSGGPSSSSGDSSFCEEVGAILVENADGSATCTVEQEGRFADITSSDGPTDDASFTVVSPGVVRVALKTDGMAGQLGTEGQDAQTLAMMKTYFDGHSATIRIKGKKITDTNLTLSGDGKSAEIVIPFLSLMDGTAELPDELFAVVDTN